MRTCARPGLAAAAQPVDTERCVTKHLQWLRLAAPAVQGQVVKSGLIASVSVALLMGCGGERATAEDSDTAGDASAADVTDTSSIDPRCPSSHPWATVPVQPTCYQPVNDGLTCSWPAVQCPAGLKPANTCRCDRQRWVCSQPFHNCLPVVESGKLHLRQRPAPEGRPVAAPCDASCREFEVCVCADGAPGSCTDGDSACVPALCRTDADCAPGGMCSPSLTPCGTQVERYACHHPDEIECLTDDECGLIGWPEPACQFDPTTDAWRCIQRPHCD